MNPAVLRRFIILMAIATLVLPLIWISWDYLTPPPGDFETREGDIHLSTGEFEEAIEDFDAALVVEPGHYGAMMGRAVALLQLGRMDEAEAAFHDLIAFLAGAERSDNLNERGVLAAAHANLGILLDRQGRYEEALVAYDRALRIDAEAVEGPGVSYQILHDPQPATVANRAAYLAEQLALPEDERLLAVPELDDRQRMFRP